ncbi:hypothetical protein CO666_05765 [Rhizobium chutanense]|uniref:Uncharacterized protein n=1 Tax=Rhizobium chutanense TaxID=2035448 RepID=A0A2A6JGL1_9HYPH|nr:hypothetical protein [Rhizobium chutanense]PDT05136.1 hypothetical protein CO666_05765 [Rhizobium chutanense]
MDSHEVVEVGEEVIKEAFKKEPKGLKPKSISLTYFLFMFIGYSHEYTFRTLILAMMLVCGIMAIRLAWWNLTHTENFNRYGALLFESLLFPIEFYALGWILRVVFNYFGWNVA